MAGVITRGSLSKARWEGINVWYGEAYNEWPVEYNVLFDKYTSSKAFEEDVYISGFGLASVKPEGEPIPYDSMTQGFITRYTMVEYGLGFIITNLMVEDDQYGVVAPKRAKALAFSMRQTKEVVGANVYSNGFDSAIATGGDGLELFSTAHINVAGGTWQNTLTTQADLSEATLEQSCIDIAKWTNDRGLNIAVMPESLHIPVDSVFEAERILKSPLRVGTAENDANALRNMGKFPGGTHINHYFTDTDAFYIRTNCPDSMKYWERRADDFDEDNEFETRNLKYQATGRYVFGWSDPRGAYASQGA